MSLTRGTPVSLRSLEKNLFARCALAVLHTAPPPPSTTPPLSFLSCHSAAEIEKAAQGFLHQTTPTLISYHQFLQACTESCSTPPALRMDREEANAFLAALVEAGAVWCGSITNSSGEELLVLSLQPECFYDEVNASLRNAFCQTNRLPSTAPCTTSSSSYALLDSVSQSLASPSLEALPSLLKQLRCRRREEAALWALLLSLQLAGLSAATFLCFGWEIMEPICYFLVSGASLGWMARSLWNEKHREAVLHSAPAIPHPSKTGEEEVRARSTVKEAGLLCSATQLITLTNAAEKRMTFAKAMGWKDSVGGKEKKESHHSSSDQA